LILAGLACIAGPPRFDDWKAEVVHDSRITDDPDLKMPMLKKGRSEVLLIGTKWGKLPIIMDTEAYAEVMLVPPDLETGSSFSVADRKGVFREGGMEVTYESHDLQGTIRVVEATPEAAVLDVDLWARSPIVDVRKRGDRDLTGRVRATHRKFGPQR
jgi:hypothetical protein